MIKGFSATNVKKNLDDEPKVKRGRPPHPYKWPFPYPVTQAAMHSAELTYQKLIDAIYKRTGRRTTRQTLYQYFKGAGMPANIYEVLLELLAPHISRISVAIKEAGDVE